MKRGRQTRQDYNPPPDCDTTAYQRLFGGQAISHRGGEVFKAILKDFLGKGE